MAYLLLHGVSFVNGAATAAAVDGDDVRRVVSLAAAAGAEQLVAVSALNT